MKRVVRFIGMLALSVGMVLGISVGSAPTASAASYGGIGVYQKFFVAPFSKPIKVSNGPAGWGLRETVYPMNTATFRVHSIWLPAHCTLQTTYMGFNFMFRNDTNKGKWKSGKAMPIGKTVARITCRR